MRTSHFFTENPDGVFKIGVVNVHFSYDKHEYKSNILEALAAVQRDWPDLMVRGWVSAATVAPPAAAVAPSAVTIVPPPPPPAAAAADDDDAAAFILCTDSNTNFSSCYSRFRVSVLDCNAVFFLRIFAGISCRRRQRGAPRPSPGPAQRPLCRFMGAEKPPRQRRSGLHGACKGSTLTHRLHLHGTTGQP